MIDLMNIGPIPQIGYGTWQRDGQQAYDSVRCALDVGYRHIDTAENYGNEEFVGQAIADSAVARSDIFVTTKVAPDNFGPGQIMPCVQQSLKKLQTEQVDLLLLHWPAIKQQHDIVDYMKQFAEVYDAGLAKYIGVSNFTKHYLDRALELLGDRPITTNQCEIHVFQQNRPIVEYAASKGIPMTAYSPLACGEVSQSAVLRRIGESHGADNAQIALAFLMAEGHVVIPTSSNPARIASNFAAKDIKLSAAEIAEIRTLEDGRRMFDGDWAPVWDI